MTYTITLQPSGHHFAVTEDDVILDKALAVGIYMPHGCRAGTCKSCKAKVVEGTVDMGRAFPAPAFLLRLRQMNGYTLMCRATATSDLVIEVDETRPLPPARSGSATVAQVEKLTADVAVLRLDFGAIDAVTFMAGQYIDLRLADGVRRSYSIATPPDPSAAEHLEFHIRHMPGGLFTDPLFAGALAAGAALDFEGPLGSFTLRDGDFPVVMVASGTGYAPIRAILLDALGRYPQRRFVLYWGARRRADLYREDEAAELARAHANFSFVPVLSEPDPEDGWSGRTGFVHAAVMEDILDLSGCQVYACGTPLMVEAARRDFMAQRRLPADQFFADSFLSQADTAAAG